MLSLMCALARRYPFAEKLIARAFAPDRPPARPCAVRALLNAPNRGDNLVIRGCDGVYAVCHRVSLVGTAVIILATLVDADGYRFEATDARDIPECLPGVTRVAFVAGRWSIAYPVDGAPIDVDPFPA